MHTALCLFRDVLSRNLKEWPLLLTQMTLSNSLLDAFRWPRLSYGEQSSTNVANTVIIIIIITDKSFSAWFNRLKQWRQMVTFWSVQCHPGLTYIFNFRHSGTLALSARVPQCLKLKLQVRPGWLSVTSWHLTPLPSKGLSTLADIWVLKSCSLEPSKVSRFGQPYLQVTATAEAAQGIG